MPEGPEIRRAADRVVRALRGRELVAVYFSFPELARFEKRLLGRRVTAVDTRGKAMLTRFDNGLTLYSHNQLYGRWYTTRRGSVPDTRRDLRVALHTASQSAFLYSASDVAVLNERQLAAHPFLNRIGPDVLDRDLRAEALAARLASPGFRGRTLASLYLDQAFLAGIGNYLRSEILFAASVDPGARPSDIGAEAHERIARESIRLARRSYRTRGVTLAPKLADRLKAAGRSFSEYRFWVFDRAGQACRRCGTTIERRVAGSRGLFVCPNCQRPPR